MDLVSTDSLRDGETPEEFHRRMAREKPPSPVYCPPCQWCGQDHRGPKWAWPAEELEAHEKARAVIAPPPTRPQTFKGYTCRHGNLIRPPRHYCRACDMERAAVLCDELGCIPSRQDDCCVRCGEVCR